MFGLSQFLSPCFVQFVGLAAVVVDRSQVAQGAVQSLAVVPVDDLSQHFLGLLSVDQLGLLQCFSQGSVAAFHQAVLFRR